MDTQVLIAGAGPTGLTLALWLRRAGIAVRIVDRAAGPGDTSRALAVQARTLEFQRQLGIVDSVLEAGIRMERIVLRSDAGVAVRLALGEIGQGLSPYPFIFALPQDVHERVLITALEATGTVVERDTALVSFVQGEGGVRATLRRADGEENVEAGWLCGCDGAHSAVRHGLGIGMPGGTYEQVFYVADVTGHGEISDAGLNVRFGPEGFGIVLPVRQQGSVRLIGIVPSAHQNDETIRFEDIRAAIEGDTGVVVDHLNWFSTYRIHHRVAERFRVGRVFIAGDAGHIHSPAGGQGMNTGIGDAVNLAWKLAAVAGGCADPRLLDSYEPERIAFARRLVATTDRAFQFIASPAGLPGFLGRRVFPRLIALALRTAAGRRFVFRTLSQTVIHYRASGLGRGTAGRLRGGDRMPWTGTGGPDNFAPLASLDWQVHVHGEVDGAFRAALAPTGVPVVGFPWSEVAGRAGIAPGAAYLLRPDGHVALASPEQEAAAFLDYLGELAIRPRPEAPRAAA